VKPEVSRFLEVASAHLLLQSAPAISDGYEQSSVQTLAILLGVTREEVERAAARRVEENRALRTLFGEAVGLVSEEDLRGRLCEAAEGHDESLLVSELEKGNAALRELLIALHTHVETLEGDDARAFESAIWRELVRSTERRRLSLAPF